MKSRLEKINHRKYQLIHSQLTHFNEERALQFITTPMDIKKKPLGGIEQFFARYWFLGCGHFT
jgi:hypothetical protein